MEFSLVKYNFIITFIVISLLNHTKGVDETGGPSTNPDDPSNQASSSRTYDQSQQPSSSSTPNWDTSKYEIVYFNCNHMAEPIRFLFYFLNLEFTDTSTKNYSENIISTIQAHGHVPIVEVNRIPIAASVGFIRNLGQFKGLGGKDPLESMEMTTVVREINELYKIATNYLNSEVQSEKEKIENKTIPEFLNKLVRRVDNAGYFFNKKLSWVDLYFAGMIASINFIMGTDVLDTYDHQTLKRLEEKVYLVPNIGIKLISSSYAGEDNIDMSENN